MTTGHSVRVVPLKNGAPGRRGIPAVPNPSIHQTSFRDSADGFIKPIDSVIAHLAPELLLRLDPEITSHRCSLRSHCWVIWANEIKGV